MYRDKRLSIDACADCVYTVVVSTPTVRTNPNVINIAICLFILAVITKVKVNNADYLLPLELYMV